MTLFQHFYKITMFSSSLTLFLKQITMSIAFTNSTFVFYLLQYFFEFLSTIPLNLEYTSEFRAGFRTRRNLLSSQT